MVVKINPIILSKLFLFLCLITERKFYEPMISKRHTDKPVRRIGIILVAIILLPVVIFTAFEISRLNESEQVIESIYDNQLDAILYSVNQYALDVITSWSSKINFSLETGESGNETSEEILALFLNKNFSIDYIISLNEQDRNNYTIFSKRDTTFSDINQLYSALNPKSDIITRLYTYKRGDFTRITPMGQTFAPNHTLLVWVADNPVNKQSLVCLFLDKNEFITQVLSPKIQQIAASSFVITVSDSATENIIFSTEDIVSVAQSETPQQLEKMWLIPDYMLGISLKGRTISGLVKERSYTNIILVVILNVVMIFGVWLVFYNFKREMQLVQLKSDFVANVSHELRTPLSLISMFAETLEMGRVPSEERKMEYYKIITQETNRLSRIVNKILSFSQIESGKRKFQFSTTDVSAMTDEIASTYQFHMKNKGFTFNYEPAETLPTIQADPEALSEAITNLLDNAMKYSDEHKEVDLRTGIEKDYIFIEVEDKGIGIKTENQNKVFEKFYRVTSGEIHTTKGAGLGLSLVKQIIVAHKGYIDLKSTFGKGSKFRLYFPIDFTTNSGKVSLRILREYGKSTPKYGGKE